MSVLDASSSPYLPPFVANKVPVASYVPSLKQPRTIDYVNGPDGAANFDLAPNSSMLALDQNQNVVWVIATDQNGSKSMVKGFYIGEEYVPPKPITMEDLMAEIRDVRTRVINLEEDRNNGEHNQQPAVQSKPTGSNASTGVRNNASTADGKPSGISGSKQPANETSV